MEYNNRWIRAGWDGAKRNMTGPTWVVIEYGIVWGEGTTDRYIIYHCLIVSTLLYFSFFLLPVASFLRSTTIGGAGLGVTDAGGQRIVRALLEKSGEGTGICSVIFRLLFSPSPLLLSSSHCSYYSIISFFRDD